ncbi:MAG TPA: hypothetical protein DEP35_15930 [Deltaproteobacteria bacterium]|nr:hypothetical protein [Deltaproteobacteria bacterium]
MDFATATVRYEAWLRQHIDLVASDLRLKHARMREARFPFLRATYYRWAQVWPELCADLADAPRVLAVGDLHVENFGTWRDAEGRLAWGVNDFDEVWRLPYTHDLVRLATSVAIAISEARLRLDFPVAAETILEGYSAGLAEAGAGFVLSEHHGALRDMALHRLRDPERFWEKLDALQPYRGRLPKGAAKALAKVQPEDASDGRVSRRVAGLGSLGRPRFVWLAHWRGARIAREVKAAAPSACCFAERGGGTAPIRYDKILRGAVRSADPFLACPGRWVVRRLAPDCTRIDLVDLPDQRDELRLVHAMGFETANVHLGTAKRGALLSDLKQRPRAWLRRRLSSL